MDLQDIEREIAAARETLARNRGRYGYIERKVGLYHGWISKFLADQIRSPDLAKIVAVHNEARRIEEALGPNNE